jgi:glucokinase
MKKAAIGIDIGGTNSAFGIVDLEGEVLAKGSISTPEHGDASLFIHSLSDCIRQLVQSTTARYLDLQIVGVGVGAPNANYYQGTIEHAPNLSFKGIVPLKTLFAQNLPEFGTVIVTKDANAAALGEMMYGGAKGMSHFAMYTLGTGVGSGLVVRGELVYGHDGFAGECGHSMLFPGGRKCGCGIQGHLEAYCSASGMKRTAFELLARDNNSKSVLANYSYNDLESKTIFAAAERGDELALEVFELTGKWLGIAFADTVNHLSPEAIFLFGGPTAAGELLFEPIRKSMDAHLLPIYRGKVKILPSQLSIGDAAIVGASALVYQTINTSIYE